MYPWGCGGGLGKEPLLYKHVKPQMWLAHTSDLGAVGFEAGGFLWLVDCQPGPRRSKKPCWNKAESDSATPDAVL